MPATKKYCKNYQNGLQNRRRKKYGFFAGLLLALLPKCPFCLMAYSSTVVLCGKDTLIENQQYHSSAISIVLAAFFCSLVIGGLVLNFRGKRTIVALALCCPGVLMILNSVIRNGGQELYYLGVSILFVSIWLNGSLISILRKFNNTFFISKRKVAGIP